MNWRVPAFLGQPSVHFAGKPVISGLFHCPTIKSSRRGAVSGAAAFFWFYRRSSFGKTALTERYRSKK